MNLNANDGKLVGMISQAKANALASDTTTSSVPEGTNLYFTSARARSVISASEPIAYNASTGIIDLSTTWDDLRASATLINPAGLVSPPSIDSNDGSLLFATNNAVAIWFQMPHGYAEGSNIKPHIHWSKTTTASGLPDWQMKYKWYNVGDVMPAFSSLVSGSEAVANSNTVDKHAVYSFPEISGTGKLISSMICVFLQRTSTGDTYANNARLLEFDIHYQIDSTGSNEEFTK